MVKNNPSAFPETGHSQTGMTLRDYFAAKALAAMHIEHGAPGVWHPDVLQCETVARAAYLFADAMLRARSK